MAKQKGLDQIGVRGTKGEESSVEIRIQERMQQSKGEYFRKPVKFPQTIILNISVMNKEIQIPTQRIAGGLIMFLRHFTLPDL